MLKQDSLNRLLVARPAPPPPVVKSGIYHYTRENDGTFTRFHLRVDPDGQGTLIVNASLSARLSSAGALIAKNLLDGESDTDIVLHVKRSFRGVTDLVIEQDIGHLKAIIADLSSPGDNYPIINLEDAAISPFESRLMAPMRGDIPLAPPDVLFPILDRLWQIGFPHVTFLLQDELEAESLIRAVERAEDLGMIAGARGRATDFEREGLIRDLALAGIDYISLFYASAEGGIHDRLIGEHDHKSVIQSFEEIRDLEVARVVDLPLVAETVVKLGDTLFALREMDIFNVNFFAIAVPDDDPANNGHGALYASSLPQIADMVEEWANSSEVRYVWQPTVMRNPSLELEEQVRLGPRCSDDMSVRIESSGEVIPARGPYISAGNILLDEWQDIWNHRAFRKYRDRIEMPTRCEDCPGMAICAADCPREINGWSQITGGG